MVITKMEHFFCLRTKSSKIKKQGQKWEQGKNVGIKNAILPKIINANVLEHATHIAAGNKKISVGNS